MLTESILLASVFCFQSPSSATAPAATHPATSPDVLAGPTVSEDESATATLVKRAFDGALQDIWPEADVAAVGMLELTDEQHNQFDSILIERHLAFDDLVRSHYGLILELATFEGESDHQKRIDMLNKARDAFAPYFKRGMFIDEMQEHLTAAQREQVNLMLNEYREARIKDIQRRFGLDRPKAVIRARLDAFGQMIRESIERQVGLEREEFEHFAAEMNLTDEQKSKALAIFQPLAVKRFQRIETPADRAEAYAELNKILTPEQRRQFLAILVKRWKPPEPPASAPQTQPAMQP